MPVLESLLSGQPHGIYLYCLVQSSSSLAALRCQLPKLKDLTQSRAVHRTCTAYYCAATHLLLPHHSMADLMCCSATLVGVGPVHQTDHKGFSQPDCRLSCNLQLKHSICAGSGQQLYQKLQQRSSYCSRNAATIEVRLTCCLKGAFRQWSSVLLISVLPPGESGGGTLLAKGSLKKGSVAQADWLRLSASIKAPLQAAHSIRQDTGCVWSFVCMSHAEPEHLLTQDVTCFKSLSG